MGGWLALKRRTHTFKYIFIIAIFVSFLVFTTNLRQTSNYRQKENINDVDSNFSFDKLRAIRDSALQVFDEEDNTENIVPLLKHHPFDNSCKFPIANIYAPDIYMNDMAERRRKIQCNMTDPDYATMDSEGYMYVHPHFVHHPKFETDVECKIVIVEGGLRQPEKNLTKDKVIEIKTYKAPELVRFFVNADIFIVKCFKTGKEKNIIWEKPFAGMTDYSIPKNELLLVKDLPSFGQYGNVLKQKKSKKPIEKYSVDILGFDSTGRTVFMRHLPRTVETMHKLGYHFLLGYNKIADNSMVNLAPILAGDLDVALKKPKTDASGDINLDSVLPQHDKLDPTSLTFLWQMMKEKWGCVSMFNEDISMRWYGLFNYPGYEFMPGFTKNPADHYYRAYYLEVYKNWSYSACKNGDQIQKEFVDLWKRFADKHQDICHFGFTFITTLTHEDPAVLEVLDEKISADLSTLFVKGALDNTLSIIMSDHGNRIGKIQWKYTGRIEERMPLMAIRLPTGFAQKYPEEYNNFLENKNKLTGNFDIHKTLYDIATMRFGDNKKTVEADTGRGISLFDKIPKHRTCFETMIPENFCTCMVDVSKVENPIDKHKKRSDSDQRDTSLKVLKDWIKEEKLDTCIQVESIDLENDFKTLAINQYARHGLRTKQNVTVNEKTMKLKHKLDFVNLEFNVNGKYANDAHLKMLIRTEYYYAKGTTQLVYEPFVIDSPSVCNYISIFDVCDCMRKL